MDQNKYVATFGLDASLNHGCLVRAVWNNPQETRDEPQMVGYENLYQWNTGKGNKTEFKDLCELGNLIIRAVQKSANGTLSIIGIDWDFNSVFMAKGNATAPMKMSFLIGYVTKAFHSGIAIPFMLKPYDVRAAMGIKGGKPKHEVLYKFLNLAKIADIGGSEDFKDAMLLSYCASLAQSQKKEG